MPSTANEDLHPILQALFNRALPHPHVDSTLTPAEASFHNALFQFNQNKPDSEKAARAHGEALVALAEATGDPQLILSAHLEWFDQYRKFGTTSDLAFLIHTIEEIASRPWPTLLKAWFLEVKYTWAYMRRHRAQSLHLTKACIDTAPPGSMFWTSAIWSYAIRMVEGGRLKDAQSLLDQYKRVTGKDIPSMDRETFEDACHNGNAALAAPFLPGMRERHAKAGSLGAYGVSRVYLELLSRNVPIPQPSMPIPYEEDCAFCRREAGIDLDTLLMTTRHLLAGQTAAALESARSYAAALGDIFFYLSRFDGYDMIRAELAAGNHGSAVLLLRKRFHNGLYIWVDDFFTARAALLRGKYNAAESMYRRCLTAVRHYGAEHRLRFELCLACEIPPSTLVRWLDLIHAGEPHGVLPPPPPFPPLPPVETPGHAEHAVPPPHPTSPTKPMGVDKKKKTPLVFVGEDKSSVEIRAKIEAFASIDPPVLITGETGVGKELVAQQIHESGSRRGKPFVAVNCAALSSSLLLSELFGHVRGAFTGATRHRRGLFETAGEGSLLLDEIGELPQEVQATLLRVLETGEFRPVGADTVHRARCRILAATHRDLASLVEANRFRRDLYFRLGRLEIRIPPLRGRTDDILPLALHFLRHYHPRPYQCGISSDLQEAFLAHPWKGNVRELKNAVEMLCLLYSNSDLYTVREMCAAVPQWGDALERGRIVSARPTRPLVDATTEAGEGASDSKATEAVTSVTGVSGVAAGGGMPSSTEPESPAGTGGGREHPLNRLDRLEAFIRQHQRISCRQVLHHFGVSYPTASRMLRDLIAKGVVRKVEPTRSPRTHYFEYNGS